MDVPEWAEELEPQVELREYADRLTPEERRQWIRDAREAVGGMPEAWRLRRREMLSRLQVLDFLLDKALEATTPGQRGRWT